LQKVKECKAGWSGRAKQKNRKVWLLSRKEYGGTNLAKWGSEEENAEWSFRISLLLGRKGEVGEGKKGMGGGKRRRGERRTTGEKNNLKLRMEKIQEESCPGYRKRSRGRKGSWWSLEKNRRYSPIIWRAGHSQYVGRKQFRNINGRVKLVVQG